MWTKKNNIETIALRLCGLYNFFSGDVRFIKMDVSQKCWNLPAINDNKLGSRIEWVPSFLIFGGLVAKPLPVFTSGGDTRGRRNVPNTYYQQYLLQSLFAIEIILFAQWYRQATGAAGRFVVIACPASTQKTRSRMFMLPISDQ